MLYSEAERVMNGINTAVCLSIRATFSKDKSEVQSSYGNTNGGFTNTGQKTGGITDYVDMANR